MFWPEQASSFTGNVLKWEFNIWKWSFMYSLTIYLAMQCNYHDFLGNMPIGMIAES